MTQNCDSIIELLSADPFVKIKTNNTDINSNLIGSYNFNNIAIAITIGKYFYVSLDNIKKGIENYIPTNNRSQIINKNTNKIILDAYNANPTSMKAALDNFTKLSDTNKIAVLGDMFELGDSANDEHKFISDYASQLNINHTYLVGKHFYENKIEKNNLSYFKSFDNLKAHFENLEINNTTFLIKGSRGMALERILEII
jgi:UDP-N-acetylmuramoyl-tripeptide--D-alanyl-D-alanine ligase